MFPIALGFIMLATGVGMLLSALYVRYRDIQPIWEVLSQVLFYCSPIMYLASSYKQFEHLMLTLNPIALLLTQMGYAFIHPAPVPTEIGNTGIYVPVQHMRSAVQASGGVWHVRRLAVVDPGDVRARLVGIHPRGAAGGREPVARE